MKKSLRSIAKKKRSKIVFDSLFYAKIEKNISYCLDIIFQLNKNIEAASLYHPFNNEISPHIFIKYFMRKKIILSLPVVEMKSNLMVFKSWSPKDKLIKGPLGNMEPDKLKQIITPQIMIVPLLMFDKYFYRLGYGGGYYDKSISKFKKYFKKQEKPFITIGIAHSSQQTDIIPHESHDMKLDFIVTEKELLSKKISLVRRRKS